MHVIEISLFSPMSLSITVTLLYIMVPTRVSSETLNEYGLPRNSGGLSLTSMMAISLLRDTVFASESLIGSSKKILV